ncbi:hypothetical protein L596_000243 [Steinernema carpocapsae]|nr:hypothetical protein L596_000243 [Steinernema carpocapsae]
MDPCPGELFTAIEYTCCALNPFRDSCVYNVTQHKDLFANISKITKKTVKIRKQFRLAVNIMHENRLRNASKQFNQVRQEIQDAVVHPCFFERTQECFKVGHFNNLFLISIFSVFIQLFQTKPT